MPLLQHMLRDLVARRALFFGLLASAVLGVALCFIPLFNLVGYESSMVVGVFVHIASALFTVWEARRIGGAPPLPLDPALEAGAPPRRFATLYVHHLMLIVPAGIMLSLNALRVPNCDWAQGVLFWTLGPPVAALLGQMVGWLACALAPSRRRVQWLIVAALILGNGLMLGFHVLLEPPINGHQWAIGYLNGSIYDEAIHVPPGLLWYRVTNIALVLSVVASVEVVRLWFKGRRLRHHVMARFAFLTLACATIFIGMTLTEQHFGIRVDRQTIADRLGGRVETEHFVIFYPQRESYRRQLEQLKEDHEYRYAEMNAYFGTDPVALHGEKIRSFVYPDTETKGELMGARRTLIAKIWLREIHIMWSGYGDHLLAHELAHVFTEPFGAGPLRLSMQNGIGVNMGLVEGIATAADAPPMELSSHEASAAMRKLGLAPDIRGLVGASGFWSQSSGRAYTLMGSFVQYLVDTYGMKKFKRVYRDGDFAAAYGKSASTLVGEWEEMLGGITLSQLQLDITRYRYERPSIFGKICARTIAELKRQAALLAAQGDITGAQEIYDEIVGHDPLNAGYRLSLAHLLYRAEQNEAALAVLDETLQQDQSLSPAQRAEINELRGDLLWREGAYEDAAKTYGECLSVGVLDDSRRMLLAKRDALLPERRSYVELARSYLIEETTDPIGFYYPMAWHAEQPRDALVAYMVGRRLWSAQRWELARPYLEQAIAGLEEGLLSEEARAMLGESLYHMGELGAAERMFETLASTRWSRLQTEAAEWRARILWRRRDLVK